MKKLISLLLVLVMMFVIAACGGKSGGGNKDGELEHMDLSIACFDIANHVTHAETDVILKYVEEKFNITIKPVNITRANFRDSLTLWAASNKLPDIMAGDASDTKQFAELARDGVIKAIPQKMIDK